MQRAPRPDFRPATEAEVALEGHARLTAIFVGGLERRLGVHAYLGVSPEIGRWDCF
ncbi:MAG TPA: hypothetical protein VGC32_18710 [Solirubrobacterales bacterium]